MIEALAWPVSTSDLDGLTDVLIDTVDSGGSVSFMAPLARDEARNWWQQTLESLRTTRGVALVAREEGAIVGCVLLQPAWAPNQPHRADVAKMMVHRRARRRGVARALLAAVEQRAWARRFTLLTLDTVRGGPAEQLYRTTGWTTVGTIPNYALDPHGSPCDTVVFFKAAWPTDAQIEDLAERFQRCALDESEWTHSAHLAVGTWHVSRFGEREAMERLRAGIRRLNLSLGGVNNDTHGYHETITQAYVTLIGQFVAGRAATNVASAARDLLAGPLAAPRVLLRFYSIDRLMSVTARREWVEPDLGPIAAGFVPAPVTPAG